MDLDSTEDASRSLGDLLGEGLQFVVFGNGYLIALIVVVFVSVVVLSRVFKGGAL